MEATVGYLTKVHGDLLDAAARERRGALERDRRGRVGPSRRRPRSGLMAAAVVILALAGLVGVIAKNGGIGISRDEAGSGGGGGSATGSTGGFFDATDQRLGVRHVETVPGTAGFTDEAGVSVGARDPFGGQAPSEISRVIRTGEISLVIPRDTFDATFGDAVDIAEENGGFVADSSSRERAGSLTLRVPAASFDETLRALRDLGDVQVESIRGKDVTAEYVDLGARLRIAKARRSVLLDLMDTATSIEQTLRVQNALDDTQLRIEEIQGQLRLLDDRTSLATIQLDLREQGVERNTEPQSIPTAFERAIDGFFGTIGVIVIGLGYLLPLIVIGLIGWLIATRVRRRREAR